QPERRRRAWSRWSRRRFPHQARGKGEPGLALVQDQDRPSVLADDQIALPMADLAARFNGDGSVVDRSTILYPVACRSGVARATALVATGQIPPQGLALLGGAIDERVDRLAAQRPQPGF